MQNDILRSTVRGKLLRSYAVGYQIPSSAVPRKSNKHPGLAAARVWVEVLDGERDNQFVRTPNKAPRRSPPPPLIIHLRLTLAQRPELSRDEDISYFGILYFFLSLGYFLCVRNTLPINFGCWPFPIMVRYGASHVIRNG